MSRYQSFKIGEFTIKRPVVQGGMGVGISLSGLAGAVAREGGLGLISSAQIGFLDPDFAKNPHDANMRAIVSELNKAREIAPEGVIGFNIMVATKDYEDYVRTAVAAGADVIVSGAGLPVSLPDYVPADSHTKIAPIVSSAKSAQVILKMWDRKFHRTADFVVIEGPLAGGHLGFSREDLKAFHAESGSAAEVCNAELSDCSEAEAVQFPEYDQAAYDQVIRDIISVIRTYEEKYGKKIPVISAGGVFSKEDMAHHMSLGVDGVQVGTRFVTTEECDAAQAYKDAYLKAKREDIVIVKSPVGMPGRAIKNHFLDVISHQPEKITKCFRCLEHCNPATAPYCITMALVRAAKGEVDDALLFCGDQAYRCERMETVAAVMDDLTGE